MDNKTDSDIKLDACMCHINGVSGKLTLFTRQSWNTLKKAAFIRMDDIYSRHLHILSSDDPSGSYHRHCYKEYTRDSTLKRIKQKRKATDYHSLKYCLKYFL